MGKICIETHKRDASFSNLFAFVTNVKCVQHSIWCNFTGKKEERIQFYNNENDEQKKIHYLCIEWITLWMQSTQIHRFNLFQR